MWPKRSYSGSCMLTGVLAKGARSWGLNRRSRSFLSKPTQVSEQDSCTPRVQHWPVGATTRPGPSSLEVPHVRVAGE